MVVADAPGNLSPPSDLSRTSWREIHTPYDLRRTFVSNLLDAEVDIATMAKMAGHSNIQTTAHYDRRPEEAKQRAARLLHVPYARRAAHQQK